MAGATTFPRPATGGTSTMLSVPGPTPGHGATLAGVPRPDAPARPNASTTKGSSIAHGAAHEATDSPALRRAEKLLNRLNDLSGAAETPAVGHQHRR